MPCLSGEGRRGSGYCPVGLRATPLFDTVSSVGYELGFGSDVAQLGLDLKGVPQKVVHLVAANEYRQNFSLTDITSSVQAGVGYEVVLPGGHSTSGAATVKSRTRRSAICSTKNTGC